MVLSGDALLRRQVIQRYLSAVQPTGGVWHKAFLRWVRAQDRSPDAPSIPKNASGPIRIPLKSGASGDKPNLPEEGESLGRCSPWGSRYFQKTRHT